MSYIFQFPPPDNSFAVRTILASYAANCGTLSSRLNWFPYQNFIKRQLVNVAFSHCLRVLILCICVHTYRTTFTTSDRDFVPLMDDKLSCKLGRHQQIFWTYARYGAVTYLASLWLVCFGYQYDLYGLFYRHDLVSTKWSFGQVVSVSVWASTIVAFLSKIWSESQKCNVVLDTTDTLIRPQQ